MEVEQLYFVTSLSFLVYYSLTRFSRMSVLLALA
jgi:hypothetical protein